MPSAKNFLAYNFPTSPAARAAPSWKWLTQPTWAGSCYQALSTQTAQPRRAPAKATYATHIGTQSRSFAKFGTQAALFVAQPAFAIVGTGMAHARRNGWEWGAAAFLAATAVNVLTHPVLPATAKHVLAAGLVLAAGHTVLEVARMACLLGAILVGLAFGAAGTLFGALTYPFVGTTPRPQVARAQPGGSRLSWESSADQVSKTERLAGFLSPERKRLQTLVEAMGKQMRGVTPRSCRREFATIFFDALATPEQRRSALRINSAKHADFLAPAVAFLQACANRLKSATEPLPSEAARMLARLQRFLESCTDMSERPKPAELPEWAKDLPSELLNKPIKVTWSDAQKKNAAAVSARLSEAAEQNLIKFARIRDLMEEIGAVQGAHKDT